MLVRQKSLYKGEATISFRQQIVVDVRAGMIQQQNMHTEAGYIILPSRDDLMTQEFGNQLLNTSDRGP